MLEDKFLWNIEDARHLLTLTLVNHILVSKWENPGELLKETSFHILMYQFQHVSIKLFIECSWPKNTYHVLIGKSRLKQSLDTPHCAKRATREVQLSHSSHEIVNIEHTRARCRHESRDNDKYALVVPMVKHCENAKLRTRKCRMSFQFIFDLGQGSTSHSKNRK